MVNPVSYGSQPQTQEKKKHSVVLPALIGGAAGAGIGHFAGFAKTEKYDGADAADKFVKSPDAKKELEAISEHADDKTALIAAIDAQEAAKTANDEKIKALFPKDDSKATIKDVLGKLDTPPSFEELKAAAAGKDAIEAEEALVKAVKEVKVDKDPVVVTANNKSYQVSKGEGDVITFIEGTGEGEKKEFKGAPTNLANAEEAATKKRAHLDLATHLGIDKDATEAKEVSKEAATKAFGEVKTTLSDTVTKAFENIKKALPKKLDGLKMAGFVGVGLALGAGLAYLIGGGSKE